METNIDKKPTGLALLRAPFPVHQISKRPNPTRKQTEAVKADYKIGIRCNLCGTWHHPEADHLDYVGHSALTDRLLDADPLWSWEPMAFDEQGLPRFDATGGLWGKLTVCGVTRPGYGHAQASQYKEIGSREKEVIGDFLRNAAMRFGAALELWHKGTLHIDEAPPVAEPPEPPDYAAILKKSATSRQALGLAWQKIPKELQHEYVALKDSLKASLPQLSQVA